jgi:hypothetical protein
MLGISHGGDICLVAMPTMLLQMKFRSHQALAGSYLDTKKSKQGLHSRPCSQSQGEDTLRFTPGYFLRMRVTVIFATGLRQS